MIFHYFPAVNFYIIFLYYSLSQLTQLEILNIGYNTLNTVPNVVSSLASLKQLNMNRCRISSLPGRLVCHMFITTSQHHNYLDPFKVYLYTIYIMQNNIQDTGHSYIFFVLSLSSLCYTMCR